MECLCLAIWRQGRYLLLVSESRHRIEMTAKSILLLLASAGAATTSTAIFRATLKDR